MSSSADSSDGDYFNRFANADTARAKSEEKEELRQQAQQEALELHGEALELFQSRVLDTFTVERHDTEIEFYRPVDASNADLDDLEDQVLASRLKRGSRYLAEFEDRQREIVLKAKDDDKNLIDLYEESLEGTELMRKTLSAFAVDESFRDPRIWKAIFQNDERVKGVFEDFFSEGSTKDVQKELEVLQEVVSGDSSQT